MPTKKKTKKAAKKPAEKPAAKVAPAILPSDEILPAILQPRKSTFHILEQPKSFMDQTKANMTATAVRRKNRPVDFKTLNEIRRDLVPVRDFMFQWLIDSYGIAQGTIVDILGAPHTGKTGLAHWLLGGFMDLFGAPCYMQNSEAKPYTADWGMRFLHSDPTKAILMSERLLTEPVFSLTHSIESLVSWVDSQRGRQVANRETKNVPLSTPLVAVIDTWSKLMNPKEEVGRYAYADNLKAEVAKNYKEIGEGSNLGHASFAAGMGRVLPYFLTVNNVILILVRHQFEKINMSKGGGGSNMDAETAAKYNTTSTGGKSFDQNAALQFIMGRKGQAKNGSGDVIGDIIWCRCSKNSFGTKDRQIDWTLQNKEFRDRPDYIAPALLFSDFMGQKFTDEKWLGVQADKKRITCKALEVTDVAPAEFSAAFHANTDVMLDLGKRLRLSGYINIVDEIKKQIAAAALAKKEAEEAAKAAEKAAKDAAKNPPKPPAPPTPAQVREMELLSAILGKTTPDATTENSPGVQDPEKPGEPVPDTGAE